jgi:hypothetical protein
VVVHGPELRRRRRCSADRLEGRQQALLEEPLRVLLRLPDLDHPPAAIRARSGDVEDAACRLLQAELLADGVVALPSCEPSGLSTIIAIAMFSSFAPLAVRPQRRMRRGKAGLDLLCVSLLR